MMLRIMAVLLVLASSVALGDQAVPSRATFRISDDLGSTVTNVTVDGCFLDLSSSGTRDPFHGLADTNGIFLAKGEAWLGLYARFTCDGYYPTTTNRPMEYTQMATGKRRIPVSLWDVDMPVGLKRIRNPIPMTVRSVDNPYVSAFEGVGKYCLGRSSGYDFLIGEFMPPHGAGQMADVEFTWKMSIYSTNKDGLASDYDTLCDIQMPHAADGICKGVPDGNLSGNTGSEYISEYEAPENGYTNSLVFSEKIRHTKFNAKVESNDDHGYLYYFRIRTQTNEIGQVTNALYGKIYGHINGSFVYYLNPTPNDRNVENKR